MNTSINQEVQDNNIGSINELVIEVLDENEVVEEMLCNTAY